MTLVCFAVPQEARPFQRLAPEGIRVLVTGMGAQAARTRVREALAAEKPDLVLTCGFAGGLNPALPAGRIVYSAEGNCVIAAKLQACGTHAKFLCAERVLTTSTEKLAAWKSTAADAVEMESAHICKICAEAGIPNATVRVILDVAGADLPLDFNAVMDANYRIIPMQIAAAIAKRPSLIPRLLELNRQSRKAAEALAQTLLKILTSQ